jgi:hypothetical protein
MLRALFPVQRNKILNGLRTLIEMNGLRRADEDGRAGEWLRKLKILNP